MLNIQRNVHALLVFLIAGLVLIAGIAACSDDKDKKATPTATPAAPGGIAVKDAWVRATVPQATGSMATTTPDGMAGMAGMGQTSGAFMTIENTSDRAERLIRVEVGADVADKAEIHETTIDSSGVMKMRPVEGVDVPAHGSAELKSGSYHIMLLDVKKDLNAGDKITLTLVFESGQQITVEAEVRPLG